MIKTIISYVRTVLAEILNGITRNNLSKRKYHFFQTCNSECSYFDLILTKLPFIYDFVLFIYKG